jgi:predicted nucleic acid-binding protein
MDVVVDANIVFSALIKRSYTLDLMFFNELRLFSPEFLIEELLEHKDEIISKSGLTSLEYEKYLEIILRRIRIVPTVELLPYIDTARKICLDTDDVDYVALSLMLNIPIWTNDKKVPNKITTMELKKIYG